MTIAARIWKLGRRAGYAPAENPFAEMDLEPTTGHGARPASLAELLTFIAQADKIGRSSVGTAALIAFEWLRREVDIIGRLAWTDYHRGDRVRIAHGKTNKLGWYRLANDEGPLFPEIEARFADTPRVGTLIIMPDKPDRRRTTFVPYTEHRFRHLVREIADAAGLPKDLRFASFRKGGFTEGGDASATDQELVASGRHKTRATL